MSSTILKNILIKVKIFLNKYKNIIILTSTLILIDQISKLIATYKLLNNDIYIPKYIGKVLSFCHINNKGFAFNILDTFKYTKTLIFIIRIILIYVLTVKIFKIKNYTLDKKISTAYSFICAGGISNTTDFIFHKSAIDIFYFNIFNTINKTHNYFQNISFNLADIFILIGAIYFIFSIKTINKNNNNE